MGGKRNIGFYKKARESLVRVKSPGNDCLKESFWNLVQETKLKTKEYV